MKPTVGITMGDAAGIGPEIIMKALGHQEVYNNCNPLVIGDAKILERVLPVIGSNLKVNAIHEPSDAKYAFGTVDVIDLDLVPADLEYGKVSAVAGDAAFQFLAKAIDLAKKQQIHSICTAPLNKEALHLGGHLYPGHTEILADLTDTEDFSMMLTTPNLRVIHLTTHMGLIDAIASINPERTYTVVKLAHDTLKKPASRIRALQYAVLTRMQVRTDCSVMVKRKKNCSPASNVRRKKALTSLVHSQRTRYSSVPVVAILISLLLVITTRDMHRSKLWVLKRV